MKIIGITGGTGAGKSAVCAELKKYNMLIVDCDEIAREVVQKGQPALREIAEFFGKDVLTDKGELDRKRMGRIVFSDSKKLSMLNQITHKHIFEKMRYIISNSDAKVAVLDVPLLFQCDFPVACDITVAVTAPKEERVKRIMLRDGIDRDAALARMSNQLTDEEYRKMADMYFENDGDCEKIQEFAKKIFETVTEI